MPILQKSSLEENDILQGMWAELLAQAAMDEQDLIIPAFIDILAGLSPHEAQMLDLFASFARAKDQPLYNVHLLSIENNDRFQMKQLRVYATNMVRLGIWKQPDAELDGRRLASWIDERLREHPSRKSLFPRDLQVAADADEFEFTPLGRAFVKACIDPTSP